MAVYWTLVQWRHRFQVSGFFGMCDPGCGIQDMSNLASQTFLIRILFHRAKPILSGVEGTPSTQRSSSLTHFLSPFLPSPFSLVMLLGCRVVLACLPDTVPSTPDPRPSFRLTSSLRPRRHIRKRSAAPPRGPSCAAEMPTRWRHLQSLLARTNLVSLSGKDEQVRQKARWICIVLSFRSGFSPSYKP